MKNKQAPVSVASVNGLEKQALSLSKSGKYKDAISLYKKLLHEAENQEWSEQLAYCYLQRALAFAAKRMFKEAQVLWENHSQYTQPPFQSIDHYITWLIQTNNPSKIQSCLNDLSALQLDKQYPALAGLLGLLMITEHPEFAQALPQDSALIIHFKVVEKALQAYQENDLVAVNELLTQLPYRSAFRDFRTLLKAAIAARISTTQTQSLVAKIPASSPYSQTSKLLLVFISSGSSLVQELLQLNQKQRRIIGELKGLNKKQIEFIEQLSKHKERLNDKTKFNLAIRYQSLLGSDLVQGFCRSMLTTYPAGRRDFNKNFGSLSEFEECRLQALTCEHNDNAFDADYYWRQCVQALIKEGTGNTLKIALILRHIAGRKVTSEGTDLLIESLEYDPEDRDSYLQILSNFSQQQETAGQYKLWLTKTIKKFPLDIDVLSLAIHAAINTKAYKKASQYASKILKLDPLNSFAKQVLYSSHLAHARSLIQEKKYHLVENEIAQAEVLKIGKDYAMHIQLMRGLFCFAGQDKKQGLEVIAESFKTLKTDPVNAHFQAAMEALLTGLPVATILRALPPVKDHLLSEQELTRFIQLLTQYAREDGDQERLHKALEKVKAALKKSLQHQEYPEKQLLTLCQTLDDIKHFELMRHCSKIAQAKWKTNPLWLYYRIYSEVNGNPEQCSYLNLLRLEKNHELARHVNDNRAMVLIDNFLDRYYEAHPEAGFGFLEDAFAAKKQQDELVDPIEKLFDHLPDDVFYKINKKINSLIKKTTPERLIRDLGGVAGDKNNILLAMMQEPDLYSALMFLRAADVLSINIDVSVDDVLECFGVNKQASLLPFPV